MATKTIEISEEELKGVMQAYHALQAFLEKTVSPNELYHSEFIRGLQEALGDVKTGRVQEVHNFDEFIQ